jgi:hypothetical protein
MSYRAKRVILLGSAAMMMAGGWAVSSAGAAITILDITTTELSGSNIIENDVQGAGLQGDYSNTRQYDLTYTGATTRLDSITTALGTFFPTSAADFVFRRTNTPDNDIVYYRGGTTNGSSVMLQGAPAQSLSSMFGGNNLNVGVDNMFANSSDNNGNFSNIERIDFVFANGVTAVDTSGFSIIERGNVGDHDAFGIVAITKIDGQGNPIEYATLNTFALGAWGNTALGPQRDYVVMRKDNTDANDSFGPSATVHNSLGGLFVPLTDLVPAGTTFYGFSLVGGDVTASGNNLVDWTNPIYFPNDTLNDNDNLDIHGNVINVSPGGLDATGTVALLYTAPPTAVPEPASLSLLGFAGLLLAGRRRRGLPIA